MERGRVVGIGIFTLLILLISPWPLSAQTSKPPSLKEQLDAQYAPGAVLVIQKEGILSFAPNIKTCPAKYQDGKVKPPESSCAAPLPGSSRPLAVGAKVSPSSIQVNLYQEQVLFGLVPYDPCDRGVSPSSYKAQVVFQFARGYLEKGQISAIEDTIGELLALDQSAGPPAPAAQGPSDVLTNCDIVRMARAKLGDGIIIGTIKSSACNFDVSVNGMVELKKAGVGDSVIQAMRDAQSASAAGPANDNDQGSDPTQPPDAQPDQPQTPPQVPGQLTFPVRHRHISFDMQTSEGAYYCSGTLSVSPDGTVAYDCSQTDDPSGRCEHVSFAPGSLKQAKIAFAGNLHLESKTQGRFDFFGSRDNLNKALAAIAPQVKK